MHDDTTTTPPSAIDPDDLDATAAPGLVVGPDRTPRALCTSVFDRWRCGLDVGHGGLHTAVEVGATTSWNDAVAGRMLRDL